MNIFIAFEVSEKIEIVKEKLTENGYFDFWISNKIWYPFPSNCVWKKDSDLSTCLNDVENVVNELNNNGHKIILKSCIVLSAQPWEGKPSTDKSEVMIAKKGEQPRSSESIKYVEPPGNLEHE